MSYYAKTGTGTAVAARRTLSVRRVFKRVVEQLRAAHQLAPTAFYNWGNAIGDPTTSTGFAMFGPSPHSAWKAKDVDDMIGPLWGEKDEAKRIAGWKTVDRYIAEPLRIEEGSAIAPSEPGHGVVFDWKSLGHSQLISGGGLQRFADGGFANQAGRR